MPEFVDILQFGDSFYDCMLTAYTEINDVEAIRTMLEGYAEIEEVKVANSKRQNRLESGSVKCRFSTDSEEVK